MLFLFTHTRELIFFEKKGAQLFVFFRHYEIALFFRAKKPGANCKKNHSI